MFWIDFSKTSVGAVVMLSAMESFNKDFFPGTLPLSLAEARGRKHPNLRASGHFLGLDRARCHF
jgi:hypothetical protein